MEVDDEDIELDDFQLMQNYPRKVFDDKGTALVEAFGNSKRENLIVHEI
jgi:hypothetical protein